MSARLGLNEIAYETWKGKTFTQIISKFQKNKNTNTSSIAIFRAMPMKNYRREIATNFTTDSTNPPYCSGNSRFSSSIRQFEQPNGFILHEKYNHANNNIDIGVKNTLDSSIIKNKNHYNEIEGCGQSASPSNCLSTQRNALTRCRTSGIIKKKYYTDTKQYLYSRHSSFDQNQSYYISNPTDGGNAKGVPGSPESILNTYVSGGCVVESIDTNNNIKKCSVVYKPNNYNYAKQGGVESSSRTDKLRYNTLNTVAGSYKGTYGQAMADSVAYSIPSPGYNIKEIIGYPVKKTCIVKPDGTLQNCVYYRSKR